MSKKTDERMRAIVAKAHERRLAEAHRLREVWRAGVYGSRPMRPWESLSEEVRSRWLALADDSLSRRQEIAG